MTGPQQKRFLGCKEETLVKVIAMQNLIRVAPIKQNIKLFFAVMFFMAAILYGLSLLWHHGVKAPALVVQNDFKGLTVQFKDNSGQVRTAVIDISTKMRSWYITGEEIDIYYDPVNPEIVEYHPGIFTWIAFFFLGVFLYIAYLHSVAYYYKKRILKL